jgi:CCR4-NOT transcription complex subunit 9
MANLPSSLSLTASSFGNIPAMLAPQSPSPAGVTTGGSVGGQATKEKKMAGAELLVLDLCDPDLRENALLDLSKVFLYLPAPPDTTSCCSVERTRFEI